MAKAQSDQRIAGKIIKLVVDKGFGFIVDDNGTEYFFHRSAIHDGWNSLQPQQRVTFVVDRSNPKGPRAEEVQTDD